MRCLTLLFAVLVTAGCSSVLGFEDPILSDTPGPGIDPPTDPIDVNEERVADGYVAIVRASYADSIATAQAVRFAIDAFIATPDATTLKTARDAWKAAREPYGQTDVYRFYGGPIDRSTDNRELRINAWPLNETHIDYVVGGPSTGIINNTGTFPTISKQLIAQQNMLMSENNISSGYHAIEFLLWGQDTSDTDAGARPSSDYTAPAQNSKRRGDYLVYTAELLVDDLTVVSDAWKDGAAYANDLHTHPHEALRRMLQGMVSLAGDELLVKGMKNALATRDQEDEQSCFSDNTHRDLLANAIAIQNAYLGRYTKVDGETVDGPGIDELVKARNAELDAKMQQQAAATIDAIKAIPTPFDQAIKADPGVSKVRVAIDALEAETATIVEVATLLDVTIVTR